MDIEQWMAACPDEFPEYLDGTTCNHNPVIGTTQKDTLQNVLDMLGVFQELILFSQNRCVEFDAQITSGLDCILSCMMQALDFEISHRSKNEQ